MKPKKAAIAVAIAMLALHLCILGLVRNEYLRVLGSNLVQIACSWIACGFALWTARLPRSLTMRILAASASPTRLRNVGSWTRALGLATRYSTPIVALVVAALAAGSLTLLPGIVLGYAVKAAEREERERGA